ncbi:MAG TPA: four helix bundle protein [Longimicrobiales bacterium]|nr:four helix bundle protein [Longimicrobiales bacterium]
MANANSVEVSGGGREHGPEGLRVYHAALELANLVDELLRVWPCRQDLRDQLLRSVDSVIYNIAEGAGHFSPGMKIRSYELAAGSVAEARAALHRLHNAHPRADTRAARELTFSIARMLTALTRSIERRRA